MNRTLYGWRPTSAAKIHIDEQEAREAAYRAKRERDQRLDRDREWLANYLANTKRPTRFNWSTITSPITQEKDDEASKAKALEGGVPEGLGDAPGEAGGGRGAEGHR